MTDQQQQTGEEQVVEAPTQDIPESESQEQVADQPQAQQQESPESETGQNEGSDVPKDNAAWAKMRTENKRLKEVLDTVDPEYLDRLKGATQPQTYQQQQVQQITGDADYEQVTQSINYANSAAARAQQQVAQLQQQIELQQDREAERAFPELKSDKAFQQIVAEKKLAARVLGHQRTTLEIAEEVSSLLGKREEQIAVQAAQKQKDQMIQAQAISSEPRGKTTGGRSLVQDDELRNRVRRGDSEATTEVARNLIADLEF